MRRTPFAFLLLLLAARPAYADGASDARAAELFEKGRMLAREGRCAEAIPVFQKSLETEPGVGALLNLGMCYVQTGKTAEARRHYLRAKELAASRGDPRSKEAHDRATELEKRLGRLTVRVGGETSAEPDLAMKLDDEPLPRERWNVAELVDPGTHVVVATSAKRSPTTLRIVVRAAEPAELVVPPIGAPAAATPSNENQPGADGPRPSSTRRTLGWALGGVGTAGLVVGGIFGALSASDHGTVVDRCPTYPTCDVSQRGELDDLNSSAQTNGTISTIAIIGGAALLVSGVVLLLTAN